MTPLIAFLSAYFLGTIPFGLLVGKWVGKVDLRKVGSKNIGATNVFRVVGKKWGILVFLLDAAKGALAVLGGAALMGPAPDLPVLLGLGMTAIGGHSFPVWLRFRGGKGVATSLGVFLAIVPASTLVAFGLWILVFTISRIISVASLAAALIFPVAVLLLEHSRDGFGGLFTVSVLLAVFIFYTHRANIGRLIRGEEKKLF